MAYKHLHIWASQSSKVSFNISSFIHLLHTELLATPWAWQKKPFLFSCYSHAWNDLTPDTLSSVPSLSCVRLFATPWVAAHQASCPSPAPVVYSNSCPLSQWRHPTISSSVIPFSHLQSFPASGSFPMSQFFASGGQSFGASASVLPMNIQDWFPLGWTGWISLQFKGLSTVFSNTTIQKHQFFNT